MENNQAKKEEIKAAPKQAQVKLVTPAQAKPATPAQAKPVTSTQAKIGTLAEAKPASQPQAKPTPQAQAKPASQSQAKPVTTTAAKPAPQAPNPKKIDYSKRTRSYKVHKIVSTIICAITTAIILGFYIPLLVDVLTTVPDPDATVDLSGVGNALYAVFALVGAIIALVLYIPSTTLGAMGFVATLKRYQKGEKTGEKVWFGILTFLPLLIEILLLLSIALVV
ncbi:MAG: hypothetical protein IJ309_03885 [Clostridia bacterium]|nr:hypothetical protein [Clostridia bacterium]